ncbi:hypothetical protein Bcen2424_5932 [Burkholderia cenocepacia HI2424]|nr:hypothetical protein Bcen2424_5932 [Burkholderia cenocepacia HI2424]
MEDQSGASSSSDPTSFPAERPSYSTSESRPAQTDDARARRQPNALSQHRHARQSDAERCHRVRHHRDETWGSARPTQPSRRRTVLADREQDKW